MDLSVPVAETFDTTKHEDHSYSDLIGYGPDVDDQMRRTPTQQRAKDRVAAILAAATEEFAETGFGAATMTAVARRCEMAIGSLYQYFPDKEALLYGIAARHLDEASAHLLGILGHASLAPDIETVVHLLVGGAIEANRGDPRTHRLMYRDAPRPPALQERLDELTNALTGWVADELVRRSVFTRTVARRRARVLVIAVEALVHEFALDPPRGTTRAAARAEIERAALAIIGH